MSLVNLIDNIDFNLTNYHINDDINDDLCSFNSLIIYLYNPFNQIDCEIPNIIWSEPSSEASSEVLSEILSEILDNKSEFSQTSDIDDTYSSDGSNYSIDINYNKKSKKKIGKKTIKKTIKKVIKKENKKENKKEKVIKKEKEMEIEMEIFNKHIKDTDEEIFKKTGLTKYELVNMNLNQIRKKFVFRSNMYDYAVNVVRRHKNKMYARHSRLKKQLKKHH